MQETDTEVKPAKKAGNPVWKLGVSGNPQGRPKRGLLEKPMTNKEVRSMELLSLVRKFKPLQAKAIQAAAKILENPESADQNKLKSAALLISTYRQLLLDLYDKNYDDSEAEEVNENASVFSLKMINTEETKAA